MISHYATHIQIYYKMKNALFIQILEWFLEPMIRHNSEPNALTLLSVMYN